MAEAATNERMQKAASRCAALVDNIQTVIVGKRPVVEQAVAALLSQGHILIEDVPGVGKTMLAKALATSISGDFKRIQFTADLLPSDVTGVNIFSQSEETFSFRRGPVFANVLLGDEINRATPRTQSSLLEAMEELQVTVDGVRHSLEHPFMVVATQNPIELEGTYPLPFAQLDRFMVRLRIGYLDPPEERRMVLQRIGRSPIATMQPALTCATLRELQGAVTGVTVSDDVLDYVLAVVRATRETDSLEYGASPRGGLDLTRFSQAVALMNGRDYVLPDDVKASARPVLAHRVIVRKGTRHATLSLDELIDELVESVDVPV